MIWTIIGVIIIFIILKGIFNTTVRENPSTDYSEKLNSLKDIRSVKKNDGLYVAYSDEDNRAHGLLFWRHMVGYTTTDVNPKKESSEHIKELVETVKWERLDVVNFGDLGQCPLTLYTPVDNKFSLQFKKNSIPSAGEFGEDDITYFKIQVSILDSEALQVTILKDMVRSPYDENPYKKILLSEGLMKFHHF